MPVVQDAPADAQDHRSMPLHEQGERGLLTLRPKPLEQLAVGPFACGLVGAETAHVAEHLAEGTAFHDFCFLDRRLRFCHYLYSAVKRASVRKQRKKVVG